MWLSSARPSDAINVKTIKIAVDIDTKCSILNARYSLCGRQHLILVSRNGSSHRFSMRKWIVHGRRAVPLFTQHSALFTQTNPMQSENWNTWNANNNFESNNNGDNNNLVSLDLLCLFVQFECIEHFRCLQFATRFNTGQLYCRRTFHSPSTVCAPEHAWARFLCKFTSKNKGSKWMPWQRRHTINMCAHSRVQRYPINVQEVVWVWVAEPHAFASK